MKDWYIVICATLASIVIILCIYAIYIEINYEETNNTVMNLQEEFILDSAEEYGVKIEMLKALELFKELTPIYDYEPYISFECGKWCVCWINSEGDVLTQFLGEDLVVVIQQSYKWFKKS